MNEMQHKLLDTMKNFHNFCEKYQLRYYLIGGTLLGAIRHKGFIPWDDDMDIAMPRVDYERMISLKNEMPSEIMILQHGFRKEKGTFAYSKLSNTSTTLIENINEYRLQGVYIDIFPLDGAGNSKLTSHLRYVYVKFFIYLLWYNGSEKLRPGFLRQLFKGGANFFSNRKVYNFIAKLLRKKEYNSVVYSGNFMGAYGFTEIVLTKHYGIPTLYEFENCEFYGPEYAENFLSDIYGDHFMDIPPLEKRKSHHEYEYLNLKESFLDFKNDKK